jgi:hypothetical protein
MALDLVSDPIGIDGAQQLFRWPRII